MLLSLSSYAQNGKYLNQLARSIEMYVSVSDAEKTQDPCFCHRSLLMVHINSESRVDNIALSDNAEPWLKDQIRQTPFLARVNNLNEHAKEEKLVDQYMIFPILIQGSSFPCKDVDTQTLGLGAEYFQFNGKYPEGNLSFGKGIVFTYFAQKAN